MTSGVPLPGVLALGLGLARTACAYLMLPIFTSQVGPPLVRNSFFVGTGLLVLALQPPALAAAPDLRWLLWFCHEIVLGLLIGFFFASVLWALQMAGDVIDQKISVSHLMQSDPFSGTQESVFGGIFGRLALYVFAASGGFVLVTKVILESYVLWPIGGVLHLKAGGADIFESLFSQLVVLAMACSAPALVLMIAFDGFSGLVNKVVPNFNVFAASLALKSWFAVLAVSISIGVVADVFAHALIDRSARLLTDLQAVLN